MQLLTLFSLVHLLLLHPSLVYSSPSNEGALINSPAMKRAKVRSVVPRTLLQVGSAAANLDKRQTCGETCYDGSCCDVGYYCAVIQGVLGCCANGNTCTACVVRRDISNVTITISAAVPINYACSLGPNNEETCIPPDGEVPPSSSSTPRPSSTTTRTTTTPTTTTPSATIVNNSGTSTSTNTNTNTNGGGGNTPIITNGAI
ncbi:hypothetical protein CPB86DRAFT_820757, partial [Serendipita vermifera]